MNIDDNEYILYRKASILNEKVKCIHEAMNIHLRYLLSVLTHFK